MLQPVTPTRALLLLLAVTAAEAQPARGRSVTVAAHPGEPLPELRVAAGYTAVIVLDAPVDKDSVQLDTPGDAPRIRLVDVGERSVIFETLMTPGRQERWGLRIRYTDGARPEWAAFALVAAPGSEVDSQVTAMRQRVALEPCQEQVARCEGARAEAWVLADRLGGQLVQAMVLDGKHAKGTAYRLGNGLLLVLKPVKKNVGPPWTPTAAVLRGEVAPNEKVPVHAVHVREGGPGEWGEVAVEAALPSPAAGLRFILELRGTGGQSLTVDRVRIPGPPEPEREESGR
ncbi:MAG TPA: DUF2381 family protein [Hyalangium sp.]|jgi:hypothetical protein|nr:DUF2381 family protein [Hyalangium sp.]